MNQEQKPSEIILANGAIVLVHTSDFEALNKFKWHLKTKKWGNKYASRNNIVNGKEVSISMHRQIMGLSKGDGMIVDHKDGNGLNNQRDNLRVSSDSRINNMNRKGQKNKSSRFKGVYFSKKWQNWWASISPNKSNAKYLGSFAKEEDAAIAYNNAAIKYYGEYAYLNDVSAPPQSNTIG